MEKLKTKYIRAIILKDEILAYHTELNAEKDWNRKVRLFKNCFVSLDIFRDSLNSFKDFLKEDQELALKSRSLRKKLQFINHIRNKISGHLDEVVLEKLVQWEPFIFNEGFKGNNEAKLLLVYKSLLESAINSYINNDSNQKIFKTEIDLLYPENQTLFFNYIGDLNIDSISFLDVIIDKLDSRIDHWDKSQMETFATRSGKTDFNLKNN